MIVPKNVKNVGLPLMGLTGQLQHIISVNQFKDAKDPRNARGSGGTAGKYEVTFVLSRPGFNLLPRSGKGSHYLRAERWRNLHRWKVFRQRAV